MRRTPATRRSVLYSLTESPSSRQPSDRSDPLICDLGSYACQLPSPEALCRCVHPGSEPRSQTRHITSGDENYPRSLAEANPISRDARPELTDERGVSRSFLRLEEYSTLYVPPRER